MLYDGSRRSDPGTLPPRPRSGGDPRQRAFPAGIEWPARLVEIEGHGGVIRGDRRTLAGLAVDLRPDDAVGHWLRDQEQIDSHALVAVEHPGPVIPPGEPARRILDGAVAVDEAPVPKARDGRPLRLGDVRAAVGPDLAPDVDRC